MRSDWKALAGAALAGLLLGAGAMRTLEPRPRSGRMVANLSRKLKLLPEQRERLKGIVEAKRRRLDALREEMKPRLEEVRESTRQEIRRMLTPEQQARFDAIEAGWKARREKRRRADSPSHR